MMELISIGVCVNFPQPLPKGVEYSPLHTCVSYDMIEGISPLVDAGADVNIRTFSEFPSTPLHLAINERKALIVQELLAKGADPYCVLQGVVILPNSKILRSFHWDCFEMAQLQRLQDTDSEEIWLILSQYKVSTWCLLEVLSGIHLILYVVRTMYHWQIRCIYALMGKAYWSPVMSNAKRVNPV